MAVVFSQILVIMSWQDTKFGSIPNLLIFGVVLLSLGSILFECGYQKDIQNSLNRTHSLPAEIVTDADIQSLPEAVQRYLIFVDVVGKPNVSSMRAVLTGEMREQGRDFFPYGTEPKQAFPETKDSESGDGGQRFRRSLNCASSYRVGKKVACNDTVT